MVLSIVLFSVFFSQIAAQTCRAGAEQGPCLNGACLRGSTCLVSINVCCPDGSIIPVVPGVITVNPLLISTTPVCVDKLNPSTGVSDCPKSVSLCNDPTFFTVMTEQCPKTCGRCTGTNITTISTMCVDLVNPKTGVSDCPQRASLCTNSNFITLMRTQCPKTCGFCGITGTTITPVITSTIGACVDTTNPSTGTSDCPQRASLCTNTAYITLMRQQCPKTCGFC